MLKKILFLILLLATTAYATEWNYTGTNYSLQDAAPTAIRYDGTNWWELGFGGTVYKYYSNWTYTGTSYTLNASLSNYESIEWDGTDWWVVATDGTGDEKVFQFNTTWNQAGVEYNLTPQDNDPKGIDWNGTNWLMVGDQNDKVYIYSSAWVYTGTNYSLVNTYPTSIIWDGTYWWVADANAFIFSGSVQKYDASFNWISQTSLNAEDNSPQSIELAQGYFWMAGAVNGRVYQYDGPNPPPPPPQTVPEFSITTLLLAVLTAGGLIFAIRKHR